MNSLFGNSYTLKVMADNDFYHHSKIQTMKFSPHIQIKAKEKEARFARNSP